MYYYLSFLRPPPTSTTLGSTIVITPQIANDLRTELKEDPTDIYHVWECSPTSSSSKRPVAGSSIGSGTGAGAVIPSGKLTTYSPPYTTYKPLSLTLPSRARVGDLWRVGLYVPSTPSSTPSSSSPSTDEVGAEVDGSFPLRDGVIGVWSGWIKVLPRGNGGKEKGKGKEAKEEKQTRIMRRWRLESPISGPSSSEPSMSRSISPEHPTQTQGDDKEMVRITIIEQTSFDLDKKIWDSGLALSSWLSFYLPTLPNSSPSSSSRPVKRTGQMGVGEMGKESVLRRIRGDYISDSKPLRILELGAGTGLVAIVLAAVLARMVEGGVWEYEIVTTDLESAMGLIEENMEVNRYLWDIPLAANAGEGEGTGDVEVRAKGTTVGLKAMVLDWDHPIPPYMWSGGGGSDTEEAVDIVIAADITYNTAAFPSLLRTLLTLLSLPSHPSLLLAYKQRDEGERDLWTLLEEGGVEMSKVDTVPGEGGEVVEIWVGSRHHITSAQS